jgi:hypothetical protein
MVGNDMKNIIYDTAFNWNEWIVLLLIIFGVTTYIILPKIFTTSVTVVMMLFGVVVGLMFDHTIAIEPIDYYDVGDEARYQIFDLFSYTMYAPFGYIYIYLYEKLKLPSKRYWLILYIIFWSLVGIGVEWVGVITGIFHYKNGFKINYSFPIYLFVQASLIWLYHYLFKEK